MKNVYRFKDDNKISVAIASSYVILPFQFFILFSFNYIDTQIGTYIQLFSKIAVALVYLGALPPVFERNKKTIFSSYLITIVIFSLHYMIFPENRVFISALVFQFFMIVLPTFIYASSLINLTELQKTMEKASRIVFILGFLLALQVFLKRITLGPYSMSLAYYILLPSLIFLKNMFNKATFLDLIYFLLSVAIIFILGSRGPLLCIFFFVILKICRPNFKTTSAKLATGAVLLSSIALTFIFVERIVERMYKMLSFYGIYSRNLSLFLDKRALYLSGRGKLYKEIVAELMRSPFIGIGIAADRRIGQGNYSHNILLEITTNFGLIIGVLLFLILMLMIIRNLRNKNKQMRDILLLWICLGFVSLFVSGSYLTSISFAVLMGLLINKRKITVTRLNHNF